MATYVDPDQAPDATAEKCSRFEVLDWLNKILDIKFTRVEQICSGTVSLVPLFQTRHFAANFLSTFPLYLKGFASNKTCMLISANRPSHDCGNVFKSPANFSV
jgi:hypothetical protein